MVTLKTMASSPSFLLGSAVFKLLAEAPQGFEYAGMECGQDDKYSLYVVLFKKILSKESL
jgi:hypothetical protein